MDQITSHHPDNNRAPDVEILEFNLAGPVLAVRPHCHTDHYWQVYFDTNRAIRESFGTVGFPVPEQHVVLRNGASLGLAPHEETIVRAVAQQAR
jgi:small conductance mechanosensitive channel